MPTATFIHRGTAIEYTPTADLPAGSVIVQGSLVGITIYPTIAGQTCALHLEGVFDVTRTPGGVMTVGSRLYWDEANQRATADDASGANPYLGRVIRESGNGDATVRIRLDQ